MRPLSGLLISILQTALETNATHVEVLADDGATRWLRGAELVGTAAVPQDAFEPLVEELCALGAKHASATPIVIQSPPGHSGSPSI